MRQRLLIAGLSAVLFLSGWGGVFASAMCRRADTHAATTGAEEGHACCRAQAKESAPSSQSSHCPLSEASAPEKSAHAGADGDRHDASFAAGAHLVDLSADACTHCFVRSENPPARFALPEPHARKRTDTPQAARLAVLSDAPPVASYAPSALSRGGAPPGRSTPRHVLHGVFLI